MSDVVDRRRATMSDVVDLGEFRARRAAAEDARVGWYCITERCRACGFEGIAVIPETADPDHLECGRCRARECEAIAYHGPPTDQPTPA